MKELIAVSACRAGCVPRQEHFSFARKRVAGHTMRVDRRAAALLHWHPVEMTAAALRLAVRSWVTRQPDICGRGHRCCAVQEAATDGKEAIGQASPAGTQDGAETASPRAQRRDRSTREE